MILNRLILKYVMILELLDAYSLSKTGNDIMLRVKVNSYTHEFYESNYNELFEKLDNWLMTLPIKEWTKNKNKI